MFQTGRMLFERIENRVLVGIIAFVSIMVLVGWVAINENARMASFERQYNARSIERGAELFAANCTTCHGTDGLGGAGVAPALNNPQLFGHDFIATTRKELNSLNKQLTDLNAEKATLAAELTTLDAELTAESLTDVRKAEIDARKVEIATRSAEIEIELVEPTRLERIAVLEAEKQAFADSVFSAVEAGYNVEKPTRFEILGWASTTESFIMTTLIHGRPTSGSYWPAPMPAWSQRAGASMRDDQLEDVTAYIMNWDKGDAWTIEDLLNVKQFGIVPGTGSAVEIVPAGSNVATILTGITDGGIVGDPVAGKTLYENRGIGCSGCHYAGGSGPIYDGIYERVVNERLTLPQFAGYTVEQYLIESIVQPGAYTVEGYAGMPANFGERLDLQNIADLVEYMKSSDPNYVAPVAPEAPATEGGES
jgi:mono/diheme cytochrome c family protein